MKIISQTPTRIGLIGGGTDVDPFASKHGGKVLSLAINLYHRVTLVPRQDSNIFIENLNEVRQLSLDKKLPQYGEDKQFDLVYAIINYFKPKISTGFNLYDRFQGNHSAGLGSSGSAAVAIIAVFNQWLNLKLTKKDIALLAWEMETKKLNWISGKQDQIMATFGGINLMTFEAQNRFAVKPIKLPIKTRTKLKDWLLLTYTGGTRHSAQLQEKLKQGMSDKDKLEALLYLKSTTEKFYQTLNKGNWKQLGKILDSAWQSKKKTNPAASNERIDFIYSLALEHGALGGKIMGAGGEGHMFFFCPPSKQGNLIGALEAEGIKIIDFDFDFQGLQIKQFDQENNYHPVVIRENFKPLKNWAVFLDRDGVVNQETHLLYKLKDFEFIPDSIQAIKMLNQAGIPVIIYHNASVVARGLCDEYQVQKIHQHMMNQLQQNDAYIDAIFYCPHHPTAFNVDYINPCSWRKPDSGMIKAAAKMFGLNLKKSYVIGDTGRDIIMGQKEKCFSILVKTGHGGKDPLYPAKANKESKNLLAAVKLILKKEKL